jgi:hypothetical protein
MLTVKQPGYKHLQNKPNINTEHNGVENTILGRTHFGVEIRTRTQVILNLRAVR